MNEFASKERDIFNVAYLFGLVSIPELNLITVFTPPPNFLVSPCPLQQSYKGYWLKSPTMKQDNPSRQHTTLKICQKLETVIHKSAKSLQPDQMCCGDTVQVCAGM